MSYSTSSSPRLSIVVPTPADPQALEETLVSVLENRPDQAEIVVVLGCDYCDPWNIGEEVRFIKAPVGSSLVACTNLGIAASHGEVIHVLAAGWRATPGWTDAAVSHFERGAAAVVPLELAAHSSDRIVAAGVTWSSGGRRTCLRPRGDAGRLVGFNPQAIPTPAGPTLEAGFWSAAVLAQIPGGFSLACGDDCADADMAVSLRALGGDVVLEPRSHILAGQARDRIQRPFSAGLHGERLFWRSLAVEPLFMALLLHTLEIIRHALARAPFGTLPVLAGRLVGILQFGAYVPRYLQLRGLLRSRTTADSEDAHVIRYDEAQERVSRPKRRPSPPLRRTA